MNPNVNYPPLATNWSLPPPQQQQQPSMPQMVESKMIKVAVFDVNSAITSQGLKQVEPSRVHQLNVAATMTLAEFILVLQERQVPVPQPSTGASSSSAVEILFMDHEDEWISLVNEQDWQLALSFEKVRIAIVQTETNDANEDATAVCEKQCGMNAGHCNNAKEQCGKKQCGFGAMFLKSQKCSGWFGQGNNSCGGSMGFFGKFGKCNGGMKKCCGKDSNQETEGGNERENQQL